MPARSQPGVKAPYPAFIVPALASAATRVPAGERWIHEVKFDGYRVQLHVVHEAIKVFTRRGHNWTQSGRELACAGKVEHGFSRADVTDVLGRLKPLVQKARPFKDTKRRPHAVWVKPALLAEVEYRAQSEAGKVRHPSFKGAARGSVTWISSHKDIDRLVDAIVEARITLGESLEPTFDDYRNLVFQMFDILDDADVVESLNRLAGYDVPKLLEVSYFEWGEQCHDNDNRKRP